MSIAPPTRVITSLTRPSVGCCWWSVMREDGILSADLLMTWQSVITCSEALHFGTFSVWSELIEKIAENPSTFLIGYDKKLSDVEAPVLEIYRIWRTSSFRLLPGTLWAGVVVSDSISGSNSTVWPLKCEQTNEYCLELLVLNCNTWNCFTAYKKCLISIT